MLGNLLYESGVEEVRNDQHQDCLVSQEKYGYESGQMKVVSANWVVRDPETSGEESSDCDYFEGPEPIMDHGSAVLFLESGYSQVNHEVECAKCKTHANEATGSEAGRTAPRLRRALEPDNPSPLFGPSADHHHEQRHQYP